MRRALYGCGVSVCVPEAGQVLGEIDRVLEHGLHVGDFGRVEREGLVVGGGSEEHGLHPADALQERTVREPARVTNHTSQPAKCTPVPGTYVRQGVGRVPAGDRLVERCQIGKDRAKVGDPVDAPLRDGVPVRER